jgi:outer membrane protein
MKYSHIRCLLIFISSGFLLPYAGAQTTGVQNNPLKGDSLGFEEAVQKVVTTHPAVLKAAEALQMAEAGVGLAYTTRLPEVDVTAGYTFLGPLPSITIPDRGTFKMGTPNNISTALNVRETLVDFSRTSGNVRLQKSSRDITAANLEMVKQQLIMATTVGFYSLVYFQEALKIKDIQIETLKKHYDFVAKKQETGSATQYELLSTKVRLSVAESQKTDIETARKNYMFMLNSLLGLPAGSPLVVKKSILTDSKGDDRNQLQEYALSHRTEMALSELKQKNARLKLDVVKLQNRPLLSMNASTGFRNGYFPETNRIKANYLAGLSLRIPLYDASRQKYQEMMAGNEISMAAQNREQTSRDISIEVYQNYENMEASSVKIRLSELQAGMAEEARKLAELSYQTGTITNLDLLDAETLEAESRLAMLKAKTEYSLNLLKLNISLGKMSF